MGEEPVEIAEPAGQPPDWRQLITAATANRPQPIVGETFFKKWDTASRPVRLGCSNGSTYVVKGPQVGRMAFNDQVAARLGRAINAPVPDDVALVEITQALIDINPVEMGHLALGIGHGTKNIEETSERLAIERAGEAYNRSRFAALAIFFGWLGGSDTQFIYRTVDPRLVYSVDHGHFFHGGPPWTIASLGAAPPAAADADLVQKCTLTSAELVAACTGLRDITPEHIAAALAVPPDTWGVSLDERVALADYLYQRRATLLAAHPADQH